MKSWFPYLLAALGLLLVVVSLLATAPPDDQRRQSLALREIAHQYLSGPEDRTTTIPPVTHRDDGSYFLPLQRCLDYDTLLVLARATVFRLDLRTDYTLSLEDCQTGQITLGAFQLFDAPSGSPACEGRERNAECSNLSLAFHPREATSGGILTLGGSLFLLGIGLAFLVRTRAPRGPAPGTVPAPEELRLDELNRTLYFGQMEIELTHRESQLLAFLLAHANEILSREAIHDAVWGVEGIIVGRSLDVFVSRLRKKLPEASGAEIQTVHGVGYRLIR